MAPRTLNDSAVKNAKPESGQARWTEIRDGGCRGLILLLSPRGEKAWAVRLTVSNRRVRHIIGGYPDISLADVRTKAREYQAATRACMGPAEVDARIAAMSMTVEQAHAEYLKTLRPNLRASTIERKEEIGRLHIKPVLGGRLIRTIRRPDIITLVTSVVGKGHGIQATRVFSEMMALLRWCEQREYVDGVPALRKRDLKSLGATKEMPRTRALSDDEVAHVWLVSATLGPLSRDLIRLLLLTGQRRDEVRLMRWEEIDMKRAIWVIGAHRYKTAINHSVPMSAPVMEILRARWVQGAKGYVLPGRSEGMPFSGQASALRRLQIAACDFHPFTLHDFRRTVRTGMSRLGIDWETAERVLGHIPPGIVRVYDQYDRLPERRQALERWAAHVLAVAAEKETETCASCSDAG